MGCPIWFVARCNRRSQRHRLRSQIPDTSFNVPLKQILPASEIWQMPIWSFKLGSAFRNLVVSIVQTSQTIIDKYCCIFVILCSPFLPFSTLQVLQTAEARTGNNYLLYIAIICLRVGNRLLVVDSLAKTDKLRWIKPIFLEERLWVSLDTYIHTYG